MIRLPEITDLFARLAWSLENPNSIEDQACDVSISNMNQSLNLSDNSRVRVLDTALSLMCFKAPQVFDSMIEYLVKTIVTVLSSSITCMAFRFQKEEFLRIGSSISSQSCPELMEVCADVLGKLEGHVMLSHSLLYAVLKVAVSASRFRFVLQLTPIVVDVKSSNWKISNVSKLLYHVPKEIFIRNQEIPLRLLLWYLDPLILKNDVSQILQEVVGRPFLCLNLAVYERMDWRSILLCLILSPSMFIETNALLHNWFLMTGLASVLELQIEVVSLILDVVSRPMWWGISMEVGLKLPFSHAYFPHKHHLLRILSGPLSCENLLHLVHITRKPVSHARRHSEPTLMRATMKSAIIDHKSLWALAMNFPCWFYFASVLLFSEKCFQQKLHSQCRLGTTETQQSHKVEPSCSSSAASYLAWILSPITESHQDLVDSLTKVSESWTLKKFISENHHKETRKLKKLKLHDKNPTQSNEFDCKSTQLWLSEFQVVHMKNLNKTESTGGGSIQKNMLFRRIPLGILIGCSDYTNDDTCELLLHYAATGMTPQIRAAGLKHRRWYSEGKEDSNMCIEKYHKKEAAAGASLVFTITDIVESMSASIFENEENGIEFILGVKRRVRKYLLKCVKKLLHLKVDEGDGVLMLKDLYSRLVQWTNHGRDLHQGDNDLDDAIKALSFKLSNF